MRPFESALDNNQTIPHVLTLRQLAMRSGIVPGCIQGEDAARPQGATKEGTADFTDQTDSCGCVNFSIKGQFDLVPYPHHLRNPRFNDFNHISHMRNELRIGRESSLRVDKILNVCCAGRPAAATKNGEPRI
ncbi:MAG: hypothetical protein EXS05_04495 [Planctomycetaceae bacterium]|nr:hypothetical protein [Planctomycetaceae bacterium]